MLAQWHITQHFKLLLMKNSISLSVALHSQAQT